MLAGDEWEHGHNFVQVPNGKTQEWMDLDVTWDPPLARFGFGVLPATWNGTEPFVGIRKIIRRWDGASIADKKKELIASLTSDQQANREHFLHAFIDWMASMRT